MTAAKVWRMWGVPVPRHLPPRRARPTIWLHRVLVALALPGLLGGLCAAARRSSALALLAIGITTAVDVAFVAEARHAFRLMPALLAAGAAGLGAAAAGMRPPWRRSEP